MGQKFLSDIKIQGKHHTNTIASDPCDISTWQINENEISVASQETNPEAIFFKSDGTKMYIAGRSGDDVNEYALSTAWDITTASLTDTLDGLETSPASEGNPYGMYISPDGIYFYLVGHSTDQVIQYTMSTAWDISTASYTREQALTVSGGGTFHDPIGINFKSDGTMFWVVSQNSDAIQQYTLSTAWDVSTLSVGDSKSLTGGFFTLIPLDESENNYSLGSIEDIWVSEDGTKVWMPDSSYDTIHQLKLSTAFDITTAVYDGCTIRTTSHQGDNGGLYVNETVGKAFTVAPSGDWVRSYDFGGIVFDNDSEGGIGFKKGVGIKGDFNNWGMFYQHGRAHLNTADVYSTLSSYGTSNLSHSNGGTVNLVDGTTYTGVGMVDVLTNVRWGRNASDQNPYTNGLVHNINLGRPREGSIVNLNIGRRQSGNTVSGDHTGIYNIVSKAQTFTHDGYLTIGQKLQVTGNADLQAFDLGGTVIFSDTFTETNTTALESHTPDTGAGWTKTLDTGSTSTWNVIGGTGVAQVDASVSSAGMIYLCDTLPTAVDYEIKVDFLRRDSSDDTFHIIFKYKDANNFFYLSWSASYSTYCKIRKNEGGTHSDIATFDYGVFNSTADNTATSLKVRFIDNKIMVWDIDSNGYQAYRGSFDVTDFTSDGAGGTFHKFGMGIGAIDGGSHDQTNTWKIDKFEVKQLSSAATLKTSTKHYIENGYFGIGKTNPTTPLDVAGNVFVDGGSIIIDTDAAGASLTWRESDSSTLAGQLRGYGNRGDIYLYSDGVKTTEISAIGDSFIPKLHIGGTSGASDGVLQTTGNVNIDGNTDISGSLDVGAVNADGNIAVVKSSAMMRVEESGGADVRMVAGGSTGYIGTYSNDTLQIQQNSAAAITIDTSRNSTFAGSITLPSSNTLTGSSGKVAFSGRVSGSTPTGTTDFTTKAYVDLQISNLVDSSPDTLNTLNELAAALGDDANFSTTVTNSIATKLPLAGGTMTGDIVMGNNDITGIKYTEYNGDVDIRTSTGEYAIYAAANGQTALYTNGVKKFETTTVGIDVTGKVQGDSLVIDGNADINGNADISGVLTQGDHIEIGSGKRIRWGAGDALIQEGVAENYALEFQTYNGSSMTEAMRLKGDNTALFNGPVIMYDTVTVASDLIHSGDTDTKISFDTDRVRIYAGNKVHFDAHDNGNTIISSNNSTALTLDSSQNATFASDVSTGGVMNVVGGDLKLDLGRNIRFGGQLAILKESNGELKFYGGTNSTDGGFEFFTWDGSAYNSSLTLKNDNNVTFSGELSIPSKITHVGDTTTWVGFDDSVDSFRVVTNGAERLHVNNTRTRISNNNLEVNGNLDLNGTANISNTLTLEGTTDEILVLKSTDDSAVYHSYYRGSDRHAYVGFGSSSDTFNVMNEESGGSMTLGTAGTTALTLNSSQNATFAGSVTCTTLVPSSHIYLGATKHLYFDGGGDTYMKENAANNLQFVVGGNEKFVLGNSQATINSHLKWGDNYQIQLGTDADVQWYHTGTHMYMDNKTGDMVFRQKNEDNDIVFQGNDGGGNDTSVNITALTLDMSEAGKATFNSSIVTSSSSAVIQTPRISMEADGTLDWGQSRDYGTLTWDTGKIMIRALSGNAMELQTNGSTTALTLDTSQNATFAGNIDFSNNKGLTWAGEHSVRVESNVLKLNASSGIEAQNSVEIGYQTNTSGTTGTTFLELDNNVGGDLSQQQTFIDFKFTDANTNYTPQVRIGAQVGPDADANSIEKEGAGSFVVYTAPIGSDASGNSSGLAESMRVSHDGDVTIAGSVTANGTVLTGFDGNYSSLSGAPTTISAAQSTKLGHISVTSAIDLDEVSSSVEGSVQLTGAQTISGTKTFSAATGFTNTTNSTSKTTGAIKLSGGMGIAKTLNVGEDVVAYASSDKRYKDNLQVITNPIDKVKSLNGYTFTWNDKHEQFNGNNDIGVVAQEVEKVFPEIVDTRDNGYKAVKYEKMVALLIEAVKDQQEQIDKLKQRLDGCSC